MAASTQQKLDYLLKKIGYTASKTGLAEDSTMVNSNKKAPFAESIPSPLVIANSSVWTDSDSIPGTPPGSDSQYVKVYLKSSPLRMTHDNTVSNQRSFIARSTYGNQTSAILGDWIDTQFGDGYIIQVYRNDPSTGSENTDYFKLSAAGTASNDTWFFDYSSGVLNFNGTEVPDLVSDTNIYIVGYRYIGAKGTATSGINTEGTSIFENVSISGNAGIGSLNVTGVSTFVGTAKFSGDADFHGDVQLGNATSDTINGTGRFAMDLIPSANAGYDLGSNDPTRRWGTLHVAQIFQAGDGISTFRDNIDANGDIDVAGNAGIGSLNVTGVSTFAGISTFNSNVFVEATTDTNQLNVTGVSTFKDDVEFHGAAGIKSAFWDQNQSRLDFLDNVKLRFGDGNDLEVWHDGSDSYIENSGGQAGDLYIRSWSTNKELHLQAKGAVEILTNETQKAIMARQDGDLELYHADSLKLETTEHGIDVTGHTETDTLNVSGLSTFAGITTVTGDTLFAKQLNVSGIATFNNKVWLGTQGADQIHVGGRFASHLLSMSGGYDLGSSTEGWQNLFLAGNAGIGSLNVTGVSTFAGITTVTGETLFSKQLNVSGVSTFVGDVKFQADVYSDQIRRYSDSGTTTKINLQDEDIRFFAGHSTEYVLGITPDQVTIANNGNLNVTGVSTFSDDVLIDGTNKLKIGNANASLYRSSNDLRIDVAGNYDMYLRANTGGGTGGNIHVQPLAGEDSIVANSDGSVDLYHNNSIRFQTTGIGVTIVGAASTIAYIEGPGELWIDPHPAGVGDTSGTVRIRGDLYVDGSSFVVHTGDIEFGDFIVGIASTVPTNALLDGAGIGIGSTGIRKFITWSNSTSSLKSSENWNLESGKHYEIAGTDVLTATTLGSGVVNSSLTSVGTLGSLTVSGNINANGNIIGDGLTVINGMAGVTASTLTGTLHTAAQTNITSVGTLTGLNVTGVSTLGVTSATDLEAQQLEVSGLSTFTGAIDANGDIDVAGNAGIGSLNVTGVSTFAGNINANGNIVGDNSTNITGIAGVTASTLTGTLQTAAQTNITSVGTLSAVTVSGNINANGNIVGDSATIISGISTVGATTYYGNGAYLTGITTGFWSVTTGDKGTGNLYAGTHAGAASDTDTCYNIAVGHKAACTLNEGDHNVFLGTYSGLSATTAACNVAIGYSAGTALTVGDTNILIGKNAGTDTEDGRCNVAIGHSAGALLTGGYGNVLIGTRAGEKATGNFTRHSVAIGNYAGNNQLCHDVYIGCGAGFANDGKYNVFLGSGVGAGITDGNCNIMMGHLAGKEVTTGDTNVLIGRRAGQCATESENNVFIGGYAGYNTQNTASGDSNVAIGYAAGMCLGTTARCNTIVGPYAGSELDSGCDNVLVGQGPGYNIAGGSYNTFLGHYTGDTTTSGSNNVAIGKKVLLPSATGSNQFAIGCCTSHWITGNADFNVGIGTTNPNATVGAGNTAKLSVGIVSAYNLYVNGAVELNGNIDLGNSGNDTITPNGRFDSDILPAADNNQYYRLGNASYRWHSAKFGTGGIKIDGNGINAVGVVTATSFDGNLATTDLTGTITNAQLAGSIANDKLANSTVSYGGIQLSLGGSDATPAFDLSDATDYPYTSLTGITTTIVGDATPKLGGDLDANSKSIDGINNLKVTGITTFADDVEFHGSSGITSATWDKSASTLIFNDDAKAIFGTSSDGLEIYHNGNNSIISDTGTGNLVLAGSVVHIKNADRSEHFARFSNGGSAELYYNDTLQFTTTGYGVSVTGLEVVGVSTFTGNINANGNIVGDNSTNITGIDGVTASTLTGTLQTAAQTNITSVGTLGSLSVDGNLNIADKIRHLTDTNTAIRFPAADTIAAETAGAERLRIDSDGDLIHTSNDKTLSLVATQNQAAAGTKIAFFGADRYTTDEEFAAIKGGLVSNSGGSGKQNGYLEFIVGSDSHTHVMAQSGNVGIGTTNPTQKLDVLGNIYVRQPAGTEAKIQINEATTDNAFNIKQTATEALIQTTASQPLNIRAQAGSGSNSYLAFWTRDDERLRIESGGNVGIGTNNPNNRLHVYGGIIKSQANPSNAASDVELIRAQAGPTGGAVFTIRAEDGSDDNSNWDIKTNASEDLKFVIGGSTEKVRIASGGQVGIGTTGGTYNLHVSHDASAVAKFERTGGAWAKVDIKAGTDSGNSYLTFSRPAQNEAGSVNYEHNVNELRLEVWNGSSKVEKMNVNPSGIEVTGVATATSFSGDGSALTGITPSAAGSNKQIQYNNSGSIGGASKLWWDESTDRLGIGADSSPDATIHIQSDSSPKIQIESETNPRQNYIAVTDSDNLVIAADEDAAGGNSSIRFRVDTNEIMRMISEGTNEQWVGIGTNDPHDSTGSASGLTLGRGDGQVRFIMKNNSTGHGDGAGNHIVTTEDFVFENRTSGGDLHWTTNDGSTTGKRMTLLSDGKVGIGTTNPQRKLHLVNAASNPKIRFDRADNFRNNWIGMDSADDFVIAADEDNAGGTSSIRFRIDASEKVRITDAGYVGINETSPDSPLSVMNPTNLGGTAGDLQEILRLEGHVANDGILDFRNVRLSDGSDWNTSAFRIQRTIDTTKMGYIDFGTGSGVSGRDIQFGNGNGSIMMHLDNGGNVGINSTSPKSNLDILDNTSANDTPEIRIDSFRPAIRFADRSNSQASAEICGDNSMQFRVSVEADNDTALTERMRITSSGHVGIGTEIPTNTAHSGNSKILNVGVVTCHNLYVNGAPITGVAGGLWHSNDTGISTSTNIGIGTTNASLATVTIDVGSATTALSIGGTAGQLFTVNNNLTSGSIFNVNDVSGIPSIDVDADGTILFAPYKDGDVGIGTTNPAKFVDICGTTDSNSVVRIGNKTGDKNIQIRPNDNEIISYGSALNINSQTASTGINLQVAGNTKLKIDASGNVNVTGVLTATTFSGSGASLNSIPYSSLTGITTDIVGDTTPQLGGDLDLNSKDITGSGNIDVTGALKVSGISTFVGYLSIGDSIVHTGDTNTSIRFPSNDTISFNTAGSQRVSIDSDGDVSIGSSLLVSSNKSVVFGPENALEIYSNYESGSGGSYLKTNVGGFHQGITASWGVYNSDLSTHRIEALDSSVDLYWTGAKKFSTTGLGVTVFGTTQTQTLNVSGISTFVGGANIPDSNVAATALNFGNSQDLKIYHRDNGHSYINNSTGDLIITNSGDDITLQSADDIYLKPQGGNDGIKIIGAGAVELYHNNSIKLTTTATGITVTGTAQATDFNSTSDIRWKTNIKPIENPLAKVIQIEGVSFNWKEDNKPALGVIADQIQGIIPELVRVVSSDVDSNSPKTVNYNGLIGLLIEAVKEQQTQIDSLKERISKLE